MNPKLLFLFIVFSFISSHSFAQDGLYIDENMAVIDANTYNTKCKSIGLKCLEYKSDSINFNKVLYKYKFGKLDAQSNNQIRQILSLDSKNTIKPEDILLIKYIDTLYNFNSRWAKYEQHVKSHKQPRDSIKVNMRRSERISHKDYSKKIMLKEIHGFAKSQKKCVKKFEKQNDIEVLHVYHHDQLIKDTYSGIKWIKDRNVLKSTFFSIVYNYNFLILKPDGNYFLSGFHLSDNMVKDLIKTPDWTDFKTDLEATLKTYVMHGHGLFKVDPADRHKTHCF